MNLLRSEQNPRHYQLAALEEGLVKALHSQPPLAVVTGAEPTLSTTDVVLYFFASFGLVVFAWVFYQQLQSMRKQGEKDISPRAKAVRVSREQSPPEANLLADPEKLRQLLVQAGIDTEPLESGRGVEQLASELRAKTCEVLWVEDPERSSRYGEKSAGRRLVRLVRLVRALVTLHKETGGSPPFQSSRGPLLSWPRKSRRQSRSSSR
jgi:hypothetical protein